MTVSFKQFSTFVDEADGKTPDELTEVFGKIFGKAEDKDVKAAKVIDARNAVAQRKAKEEERKKALQKKRDEAFTAAKERMQGGPKQGASFGKKDDKDEYALHRSVREVGKMSKAYKSGT